MTSPDQAGFLWPTEEPVNDIPPGYDPNKVAPPVPGAPEVQPYDASADRTIPLSSSTVSETDPDTTGPVDRGLIESQKSGGRVDDRDESIDRQEAARQQERLRGMSNFAGAIMLKVYGDELERVESEVSTGERRELRYTPSAIIQDVIVSESKSWREKLTPNGLTITKDPKALLWRLPGLERQSENGKTEYVALAANLTNDPALPIGSLMVLKGDLTRPAPGIPVEIPILSEAFKKKYTDGNTQAIDYFDDEENHFRYPFKAEPWQPATSTWEGQQIAGNSSFNTQEVGNALVDFCRRTNLDAAAQHFGFQVPKFQ